MRKTIDDMFGETRDLKKEDFEDSLYRLEYNGKHPSTEPCLKKAYDEGYYGARVMIEPGKNRGIVLSLAYDEIDCYYKILLDTGETIYETMCSQVIKL